RARTAVNLRRPANTRTVQVVADSANKQPLSDVVRYVRRISHTARNVAEVVRFGGLETDDAESPYTVVTERQNYRLRHYFADETDHDADGTPILLIPPLMMTAEVWDVSPATSAVAALHNARADP